MVTYKGYRPGYGTTLANLPKPIIRGYIKDTVGFELRSRNSNPASVNIRPRTQF